MKKIAIHSAGEFYYVAVDDEDYTLLERHKWYILHTGKNKRPYAFTRFYTEQDAKTDFGGSWSAASLDANNCIVTIARFKKAKTASGLVGESIIVTPGDTGIYDRGGATAAKQLTGIADGAYLLNQSIYLKKGTAVISLKCLTESSCTEENYTKAGKTLAERM